ncbi:unnamed protein product [Rotaria socialis]|uniref:Uncharacterized protein n=1 Tax=Rotaria socialis TaxID=392032 RepID=A0A820XCK2_9BILA|nr:unnamed protein product [Rotaria socialis]CAF4530354.1 unnamed protein product [Rotaria socialis]
MSTSMISSQAKLRIQSLAKPDGSFHWSFGSEQRSSSSSTYPSYDLYVNGTIIDIRDDEFWSALFSCDVLKKLDGIGIGDRDRAYGMSAGGLHVLLPHLARLATPSSIPYKPFNWFVSFNQDFSSKNDYMQFMSIIASLIRQNRLLTVILPRADGPLNKQLFMDEVPEASLDVAHAILVTHSLISLHWPGAIGVKDASHYNDLHVCHPKQLSQVLFAALEKNVSLTEVDFYCGCFDRYSGFDNILKPLLARNKALPSMNADVAAGHVDGKWDSSCPSDLVRDLVAAKFNIHRSFFNSTGDMCFCESCHKMSGNKSMYSRGIPPSRYAIPIGWVRIGLKVHEGLAESNEIFKKWHISYHGTTANSIEPIFRGGLHLLKPGDVALGGAAIGVRPGHILQVISRTNRYTGMNELFDINQIFTSPSIRYASHPAYAQQFIVDHPQRAGVLLGMRFVFQCRQRPGSYTIGHETVGARDIKLDPHFDNNELEWYTKESAGIVLFGLCVQVRCISQRPTK